jgi:hypothetical protein
LVRENPLCQLWALHLIILCALALTDDQKANFLQLTCNKAALLSLFGAPVNIL